MNLTEQEKEELLKCKDYTINNFSLKGKEFYCKIVNSIKIGRASCRERV